MHPCSLLILIIALTICSVTKAEDSPSGNSVIRGPALGSEIVITTTSRLSGAIHSLTWNGREFINSVDHGRQLQSAANFDLRTRFTGETFNPTEAGSRNDGAGETSTSRLLHIVAQKNVLQTSTQMAFWLAPGQKSGGHPAKNAELLSDHLLTKRVRIGIDGFPHVIQYDVTFSMPVSERHNYAQFEAVTGYMPPDFSDFWKFNPKNENLEPLTDGPGEQSMPVVLATKNGSHAMGVFSPDQPSKGYEEAGYGRFRFEKQKVVKWNCVFRVRDRNGVEPGDYSFRSFVIVGDLKTVRETLAALHRRLPGESQAPSPPLRLPLKRLCRFCRSYESGRPCAVRGRAVNGSEGVDHVEAGRRDAVDCSCMPCCVYDAAGRRFLRTSLWRLLV